MTRGNIITSFYLIFKFNLFLKVFAILTIGLPQFNHFKIIQHVPPDNPLRIFRTYCMIFSKTFLNSKISCISTSFKKKPSKSYSKKVTGPSIFAKRLIAARVVLKNMIYGLVLGCKKKLLKISSSLSSKYLKGLFLGHPVGQYSWLVSNFLLSIDIISVYKIYF